MPTKIWYCLQCGYEVSARGRCHSCGERLLASPLPELDSGPEDDEVGYRIDEWDDQTRSFLIQSLIKAGIAHRFEEEELVVLAPDEAEVDKLVARATGRLRDDDDTEDDESEVPEAEDAQQAASAIYAAANSLREDPTDMQADFALAEASAAIFSLEYLPGADEDHLAAVGRVTRRLLGALGSDEALEAEIRQQAEILCRLVAPSAGPAQAEAEAARARARLETGARGTGRTVSLPQSDVTPAGEVTRSEENETAQDGAGEDGAQGEDGAPAEGLPATVEAAGPGPADEDLVGAVAEPASVQPSPGASALADELRTEDEVEDDEETGELVYELAEWLPEQRVELSMLLETAGIAYNWEGSDLTVAEEYEGEVEGLFNLVHGRPDDDDEARYRAIEELFGSVDRLANDPDDDERQAAFLEAVAAVEQPTPVGVDDTYWWRVRSQGHVLVAAIENGARPDEVSREAALLAEMLHEMV